MSLVTLPLMAAHQTDGVSPAQFIAKWTKAALSERAASQEHFIDLCELLGQPTPATFDSTGTEYTFEKSVSVTGSASKGSKGAHGFADVWWRGKFAWEYKRKDKHRDLAEAYRQICQYREALNNPPLMIVSDITRTEIHTNFTGTAKQVHVIELAEMDKPKSLNLLRRVFTDPDSFKPTVTTEVVTEEIAKQFGTLAKALRDRGHKPHDTAHFLMKCMFCLFAEDVELLPEHLFERLLKSRRGHPAQLMTGMTDLFVQMKTGGTFGVDIIAHFNGGLFDDAPAIELTTDEIDALLRAAAQDWGAVEPAIFGTLFERSLDPSTRAQIGAHYTSREDILLVVKPVVMAPLRQEWVQVQEEVAKQLKRRKEAKTRATKKKADETIGDALQGFIHRLATVRILDPACGSGNFLYVAIQELLGLEKEVITFAAGESIGLFPQVRPTQLHGIEINPYAAELAQVVIWIGYLQWMRDNGYIKGIRTPILEPLQTIERRDAILDLTDPDNPKPATWPEADFIIGNPPFLGSKVFRQQGLEDKYIHAMYACFDLPNSSDLCCYWFELARQAIKLKKDTRAGLLATQGIRGGASRKVLERIKETGDIFVAWSDREWILDGAAVHVSIVGFDSAIQTAQLLDGCNVSDIHATLTSDVATGTALQLTENAHVSFMAGIKVGAFDVQWTDARLMLAQPNPNGRSNVEVVRPWRNGRDVTQRPSEKWIIDFGIEEEERRVAGYERPFEHVRSAVRPVRVKNRQPRRAKFWWLHGDVATRVRDHVLVGTKYLATPRVTKHRLFTCVNSRILPDAQLIVFARSDDYFFGVLHSSIHELWALRMGTQLEDRPRYTPTTCFETFALPWSPGEEPETDPLYQEIAAAAKELNEQRERWLNPPEWIDPIAAAVDAEDNFADVPEEARALIRQSAIMSRAAKDKNLKKRTLTNLYNERPMWLRLAHKRLDKAVLAAYASVDPEGAWSQEWAEVWLDTGAGQPMPEGHKLSTRRGEVDQLVLGNLLRMNLARART